MILVAATWATRPVALSAALAYVAANILGHTWFSPAWDESSPKSTWGGQCTTHIVSGNAWVSSKGAVEPTYRVRLVHGRCAAVSKTFQAARNSLPKLSWRNGITVDQESIWKRSFRGKFDAKVDDLYFRRRGREVEESALFFIDHTSLLLTIYQPMFAGEATKATERLVKVAVEFCSSMG